MIHINIGHVHSVHNAVFIYYGRANDLIKESIKKSIATCCTTIIWSCPSSLVQDRRLLKEIHYSYLQRTYKSTMLHKILNVLYILSIVIIYDSEIDNGS